MILADCNTNLILSLSLSTFGLTFTFTRLPCALITIKSHLCGLTESHLDRHYR